MHADIKITRILYPVLPRLRWELSLSRCCKSSSFEYLSGRCECWRKSSTFDFRLLLWVDLRCAGGLGGGLALLGGLAEEEENKQELQDPAHPGSGDFDRLAWCMLQVARIEFSLKDVVNVNVYRSFWSMKRIGAYVPFCSFYEAPRKARLIKADQELERCFSADEGLSRYPLLPPLMIAM